jgi:hypothetical protein
MRSADAGLENKHAVGAKFKLKRPTSRLKMISISDGENTSVINTVFTAQVTKEDSTVASVRR